MRTSPSPDAVAASTRPLLGSRGAWAGAAALVALGAAGLAAVWAVDLPDPATLRTWLAGGGPERWLALVLGVAVALLTPISRSALSVLLGVAAGFSAGLAVAIGGGLLGGLAGFLLSRCLGRRAVQRLAGDRLARADQLLRDRGFVAVLTARVMPVAPFTVVSYASGLSGVRLGPYMAATGLGLLPWSVLYVGAGAWLSSTDSSLAVLDRALPAAAVVIILSAVAVGTWRRRRSRRSAHRWAGRSRTE